MIKYKIWKSQNFQERYFIDTGSTRAIAFAYESNRSSSSRSAALELPNTMEVSGLSAALPRSPAKTPVHLSGEYGDQYQSSIPFYQENVRKDSLASEDQESRVQCTCDSVDRTVSDDTCAICLDVMEDDDSVRGLACNHVFHETCIDKWLMSRRACCPVCRSNYKMPLSTV